MSSSPQTTSEVSPTPSNSFSPFTFDTRLGLVFVVEASFLSTIAVAGLLLRILYSAIAWRFGFKTSRRWSMETHLHYYFLSMLIADLLQAIAGTFNIRWINDAAVVDGSLCTAQGVLEQIGDVGVALSSLAITIHTFSVLVLHWKPSGSNKPAMLVVASIWAFISLNVGINAARNGHRGYWGDTQYWCSITAGFPVQRIVLEYLWLWTTAFIDLLLYIPLYLVIRRFIRVEGYKIRWVDKADREALESSHVPYSRNANYIALQMLFYPAIYIVTVLPVGVVRFRSFHSQNVPYAATIFADVLFCSSGLFNVILFSVTRPALMPYQDRGHESFPITALISDSSRTYELSAMSYAPQVRVSVTTWREGSTHSNNIDKKDEVINGLSADV